MPTYEYVCTKCDHEFEKFQPIVDKALTICPKNLCKQKKWGKGKVKKVISAGAGLIFKGSGFYITDYRSDKYKEAAKKDTSAGTASGGETKPAKESSAGGEKKTALAKAESKTAKSSPAKD